MRPRKPKNVEVLVLGFDVERAINPILKEEGDVDRVHIIVESNSLSLDKDPKAYFCCERVKEILIKNGKSDIQIHPIDKNDFFDVYSLMSTISKIVKTEVTEGNRVTINISTGPKTAAVAGTLIALMYSNKKGFDVKAYYAKAIDYGRRIPDLKEKIKKVKFDGVESDTKSDLQEKIQTSCGYDGSFFLPPYSIETPSEDVIFLLHTLKNSPNITQKELVTLFKKSGLIRDGSEEAKRSEFRRIQKQTEPYLKLTEKGGPNHGSKRRPIWILNECGENALKAFKEINQYILPQ